MNTIDAQSFTTLLLQPVVHFASQLGVARLLLYPWAEQLHARQEELT
jgi:hypothetical protein